MSATTAPTILDVVKVYTTHEEFFSSKEVLEEYETYRNVLKIEHDLDLKRNAITKFVEGFVLADGRVYQQYLIIGENLPTTGVLAIKEMAPNGSMITAVAETGTYCGKYLVKHNKRYKKTPALFKRMKEVGISLLV